jgi:hypothetical protein
VAHKYGDDAAETAASAASAASDVLIVASTVRSFWGKRALKTLGRATAVTAAKVRMCVCTLLRS